MASITTSLRDDTTLKSLSTNEKTFLLTSAIPPSTKSSSKPPLRLDGRTPLQTRPLRLTFGRSSNKAECTAQYGPSSRCTTIISADLIPPVNPIDRPNDGVVRINVDMSPMACMGYENVQPVSTHASSSSSGDTTGGGGGGTSHPMEEHQKLSTNRILRILERTIIAGGVIDTESLCVQSGVWVWRLNIDVTVLDSGGNIVDVVVMSVLGALRHYRKPQVDVTHDDDDDGMETENEGKGGSFTPIIWSEEEKEPTPLPLHHTPLSLTYALYSDMTGSSSTVSAFLDPTDREELVANGTITICFNKHSEICSLDFPGGCEMKASQIVQCVKLAQGKCMELCVNLEKALKEADEKAGRERMDRLKALSAATATAMEDKNKLIPGVQEGLPYVEQTDYNNRGDDMEIEEDDLEKVGKSQEADAAAKAATDEEEVYRLEALDYARMHVAAKVKEDNEKADAAAAQKERKREANKGGGGVGSLMEAMLKSASSSSTKNAAIDEKQQSSQAVSSARTLEADKEFEKYAKEATQKASKTTTTATSMNINVDSSDDDDEEEEEEVTTLQSEFGNVVSVSQKKDEDESPKKKAKKVSKVENDENEDEDDVDDLAQAVVTKKKKSKKKGGGKKNKKGQK